MTNLAKNQPGLPYGNPVEKIQSTAPYFDRRDYNAWILDVSKQVTNSNKLKK